MNDVEHFYDPLPNGTTFVNSATGETHECGDKCTTRVEIGERVVCRLTKVVLCAALPREHVVVPRKKTKTMHEPDALERERASRRRMGDLVMRKIFKGALSDCDAYVDRALRVYEWLDDKPRFDAVLFATLHCLSQGIKTDLVEAELDTALVQLLPPTRSAANYGIKQNDVTKAITAIVQKRNGRKLVI